MSLDPVKTGVLRGRPQIHFELRTLLSERLGWMPNLCMKPDRLLKYAGNELIVGRQEPSWIVSLLVIVASEECQWTWTPSLSRKGLFWQI